VGVNRVCPGEPPDKPEVGQVQQLEEDDAKVGEAQDIIPKRRAPE